VIPTADPLFAGVAAESLEHYLESARCEQGREERPRLDHSEVLRDSSE
jgi:hypothetical protein